MEVAQVQRWCANGVPRKEAPRAKYRRIWCTVRMLIGRKMGKYLIVQFIFLGYTFQPRKAMDKYSRVFLSTCSGWSCEGVGLKCPGLFTLGYLCKNFVALPMLEISC
ncbi:hypothetical protein ABO04_03290 [Nitrosomonas sp. HPC101]|nr:hypothetical protein [Nitrosomonas sp. HPC101]